VLRPHSSWLPPPVTAPVVLQAKVGHTHRAVTAAADRRLLCPPMPAAAAAGMAAAQTTAEAKSARAQAAAAVAADTVDTQPAVTVHSPSCPAAAAAAAAAEARTAAAAIAAAGDAGATCAGGEVCRLLSLLALMRFRKVQKASQLSNIRSPMRRNVSCSKRPARAVRPKALSAMRSKACLIIPLQGVLAGQRDAGPLSTLQHLLQVALGCTGLLVGVRNPASPRT